MLRLNNNLLVNHPDVAKEWHPLKNGDLRGAALDVTNPEPISGYHELCSLKNCIIVPHIGTATSECRIDMAKIAAENICNHYELG